MQVDFVIVHAARALLAIVFLVAAVQKLRDIDGFAAALTGYALVPPAALGIIAYLLPLLELAAGLALLAAPLAGALLALVLLVTVTGAVAVNLLRGRRDIGCGCGGIEDEQTISWALVARNAVLMLVAVVAALAPSARSAAWLDYATVTGLTLSGYGLYTAASQLIANAPRLARLRSAT